MRLIMIVGLAFLFTTTAFSQKYYSKNGKTTFKGSLEAFEPVEAENRNTSVVLNAATGEVAALLFLRAFKFKLALMEEHFNENYMESEQFPKAKFLGKIKGFNASKLSASFTKWPFEGTLTLRGVEKSVKATVLLKKVSNKWIVKTMFIVKPEEFGIEIPALVRKKIAKEIKIYCAYELTQK